jgi:hypothetical protein
VAEHHQQSSALQGREHGHRSMEMGGASNGDNPGLNHHPLDYLVETAIGVGTLRRTHHPLGDFDSLPTTLPTGCVDGCLQPSFKSFIPDGQETKETVMSCWNYTSAKSKGTLYRCCASSVNPRNGLPSSIPGSGKDS